MDFAKQPEGNYFLKYESDNKIVTILMNHFFKAMDDLLWNAEFHSTYEAGCGEGFVSEHIRQLMEKKKVEGKIFATDISPKAISEAVLRFRGIHFEVSSIYRTQQPDRAFDLVVASEVLEHLENPEKALEELIRVSGRYLLISVPCEPIWRISNMARGKYWRTLGNTPGHIQHWNRRQIVDLLSRHCEVVKVSSPFPWTMALCRIRPLTEG